MSANHSDCRYANRRDRVRLPESDTLRFLNRRPVGFRWWQRLFHDVSREEPATSPPMSSPAVSGPASPAPKIAIRPSAIWLPPTLCELMSVAGNRRQMASTPQTHDIHEL